MVRVDVGMCRDGYLENSIEIELERALGPWHFDEKQEFSFLQNFGRLRRIARLSGNEPLPIGRGASDLHTMLHAF